jgi:hypothetical protein
MATARRSLERTMCSWATVLVRRGVPRRRIAGAAGMTDDELRDQLGV